MKSGSFLLVALIIALLVLTGALHDLISPVIKHYWAKYQHHKMVQKRREQFYGELKILMSDGSLV